MVFRVGRREFSVLTSGLFSTEFIMDEFRYRYQFEAFMDKLRGRTPQHWYDASDSIANMVWIEKVYEEVCLLSSVIRSNHLCAHVVILDRAGFAPSEYC